MDLKQQLRRGWLFVLKHALNPLTRRLARSSFGSFAIVRHIGRRTGKVYETPIPVAPVKDGFVIKLSYGRDVDWHKNVLAAGGCTLLQHGREFVINKIEPMDAETARAAFSPPQQFMIRLRRGTEFEILRVQQ